MSKIELTATPPFVKLIFDRSELEALLEAKSQISDAVSRLFVRKRVFWERFDKENGEYVLTSLKEVELALDAYAASIPSTSSEKAGLAKFIRPWAAACSRTRKELQERLDEIDAEKAQVLGYDSAGEDRRDALRDALLSLRRSTYPLIAAHINCFSPRWRPHKARSARAVG